MDRSLSFGSTANNSFALFTLAFASPPDRKSLSLLLTVSRWVIMQKARRQPGLPFGAIGLRLLVSGWIQGLFTPRQGFFSVFARATRALSVYQ